MQAGRSSDRSWFHGISAEAKADFRSRWDADRRRGRTRTFRRFWLMIVTAVRGAMAFAIATVAFVSQTPEVLLHAAICGAVVGFVWGLTSAGPWRSALLALPAYAAFALTRPHPIELTTFAAVFAILLATVLAYAAGLVHEWRRTDGRE